LSPSQNSQSDAPYNCRRCAVVGKFKALPAEGIEHNFGN
jgi:hypothetical protein